MTSVAAIQGVALCIHSAIESMRKSRDIISFICWWSDISLSYEIIFSDGNRAYKTIFYRTDGYKKINLEGKKDFLTVIKQL
jgi:hypothetical protein